MFNKIIILPPTCEGNPSSVAYGLAASFVGGFFIITKR